MNALRLQSVAVLSKLLQVLQLKGILGMKQPEKNDYQQLQTVFLGSGTLDKIVFFTMYATVDKVCVE